MVRSPKYPSPSPRPSDSRRASSRSTQRPGERQVEAAVPVKKKKKPKKVVHHAEPDPASLNLGAGPPAQPAPEEDATAGASTAIKSPQAKSPHVESPSTPWDDERGDEPQQEGGDYMSRYQVSDSEEFRNVWGGNPSPK